MHILNIFSPLSLEQTLIVQRIQSMSKEYGENMVMLELRIASILLKNKNESDASQASSFNLFVEKHMPALFKRAKELSVTANIKKSENKRNGKFHYYLSFKDLPEYSADPWHGSISKSVVLREAIIKCT